MYSPHLGGTTVAGGRGPARSQIGSWHYMPFVLQRDWFGCVGLGLGSLGVGLEIGVWLVGWWYRDEGGGSNQTTHCS